MGSKNNLLQVESWQDVAGVVIFAAVTIVLMIGCTIPFLVCDKRRISSAEALHKNNEIGKEAIGEIGKSKDLEKA